MRSSALLCNWPAAPIDLSASESRYLRYTAAVTAAQTARWQLMRKAATGHERTCGSVATLWRLEEIRRKEAARTCEGVNEIVTENFLAGSAQMRGCCWMSQIEIVFADEADQWLVHNRENPDHPVFPRLGETAPNVCTGGRELEGQFQNQLHGARRS